MIVDVASLPLSDSEITSMSVGRKDLCVELRLWNEERLVLTFRNVSGIEAFSPIGEEIGYCHEDPESPLLAHVRQREEDAAESSKFKCFVFVSAVASSPALTVVAEHVEKRV